MKFIVCMGEVKSAVVLPKEHQMKNSSLQLRQNLKIELLLLAVLNFRGFFGIRKCS